MFSDKSFKLYAPDDTQTGGDGKVNDLDISKFQTPDDIDAKLNELDNDTDTNNDIISDGKVENDIASPVESPVETDKEAVTDKETEIVQAETKTETDIDKDKEKETPEEAPETDKAKAPDKVLLTDELINTLGLSDDDKKYFDKFKGQSLDAVLKSYANAQKLIGKKKEELFKNVEIPKTDIQIPETKTAEEKQQAKDDLVYTGLSKDFPGLPKDPKAREKWLADLNYDHPREAQKFLKAEEKVTQEIDTILKQTQYLRDNSGKINQERFEGEANSIQEYATKNLNLDLKSLGYDLAVDKDGNNEILERLLADETNPNEFDPKVVTSFNGVKIVNQGALVQKFYAKELPQIINKIREGSRAEGFESKTTQTKKNIPSLAATNKGKGDTKKITTDQIKQINDVEKLDELLDAEDAQYFSR